jgi:hypothetical protein
MITPEMLASIQAGEGQALGFKTDKWKDGKNYPVEVIRDVTIEATLRGVSMVNNEVNIISGGFYMAKNGCKRRAKEWPGLSGLQVAFGVPEMKGGEALVSVRSVYWLDGKASTVQRRILRAAVRSTTVSPSGSTPARAAMPSWARQSGNSTPRYWST